LYVNGGWYSRLPYSNVWFASGNNEISRDVKNEMNAMGEAGWRWVWNSGALELTGYASLWKDKSLMSNAYKVENSLDVKYMVTGLDAFHCGVEFEIRQRIADWIRLSAFASVGNWKWMNDVSATIYDHYSGNAIGEINVYCAGLPVGDAPQTQIAQVRNHEKVFELANEMIDRVGQFMKKYEDIGSALEKAQKAYEEGGRKLQPGGQSIITTCGKLQKLGARNSLRNPVPMIADSEDSLLSE
ncbi:MAG: DNA recombination protein RmuC, partial [Rikenellaceae bacterium]|nr:DNA recombination protein RmuC [Rikenellaceae bacterium]